MKWQSKALVLAAMGAAVAAIPVVARAGEAVSPYAEVFRPPPPKKGYSYPDCYCTDSGGRRVEIGQRACLTVGSAQFTAVCGMSLNNPAWRREAEGCPTA